MPELLHLIASPRGADSAALQAASRYLAALPESVSVVALDLFAAGLPEFADTLAAAKQKTMFGQELGAEEARAWSAVEALVAQFKAADHYLLSVPMWNLHVPYKLKQYIDLITHPGLTFAPAENGMRGLVDGSAVVIYSRGGDYSPENGEPDPYDFQSPYLKAWLAMIGITEVEEVLVQRTLAGPEVLAQQLAAAGEELEALAARLV